MGEMHVEPIDRAGRKTAEGGRHKAEGGKDDKLGARKIDNGDAQATFLQAKKRATEVAPSALRAL